MTVYKRVSSDSQWEDTFERKTTLLMLIRSGVQDPVKAIDSSSEDKPVLAKTPEGVMVAYWKCQEVSEGLVRRLARYKEQAAKIAEKCSPGNKYGDWRNQRPYEGLKFGTQLHTYAVDERTQKRSGTVYADSVESFSAELVRDSEDSPLSFRDATGYYADHWQAACIRFGVAKIKTSRFFLYVAVTWNDSCDGVTFHMNDFEKLARGKVSEDDSNNFEYDEKDAVAEVMRYADRRAEHEAEEEREYQAKSSAEGMIESLKETIETSKDELRELLSERRKAKQFAKANDGFEDVTSWPAVCNAITDKARNLIREIRESREKIEKLEDNFWYAVEGF